MLFLNLAYLAAFLGLELQYYSMDCEFPYQSLFKQWPALQLQVCIAVFKYWSGLVKCCFNYVSIN